MHDAPGGRRQRQAEIMRPEGIARGANQVLAEKGYPQMRAPDELYVRMPTPSEAQRLQLGPGMPVAYHVVTGFAEDGRPVRVILNVLPGDDLPASRRGLAIIYDVRVTDLVTLGLIEPDVALSIGGFPLQFPADAHLTAEDESDYLTAVSSPTWWRRPRQPPVWTSGTSGNRSTPASVIRQRAGTAWPTRLRTRSHPCMTRLAHRTRQGTVTVQVSGPGSCVKEALRNACSAS